MTPIRQPLAAALLSLATALSAVPVSADTLLGARTVADHSETDVILAQGNALHRSVRICVAGRAVLGATAALNLLPVKAYGQLERAILKTSGAV